MTFDPPDRDDIRAMGLAELRARISEMDISDGSKQDHILTTVAQMCVSPVGYAKGLARMVNPLYATGDYLTELASLYNLTRTPASGAEDGTLAVPVTLGTTGTWTTALQFRSADGYTYQADSGGSWTAADSSVDISISAVDTGAATTKGQGTIFTVLSPPANMGDEGVVYDSTYEFDVPGRDLETDEELRARLITVLQGTGNSGNQGDYVRWMLEDTRVAEAYTYREIRNSLSVDGVPFGPSTNAYSRWLTAAVCADIEAEINGSGGYDGERAVGQDFDAVIPTAQAQALVMEVTADDGYGRDWGVAKDTSLTGAAGGTILTDLVTLDCGATDPEGAAYGIEIGDHVAINVQVYGGASTYFALEVRRVTNIYDDGVSYYLTVDEPFTSVTHAGLPGGGKIYPAGPTTQATFDAIVDTFNSLSPADDADGTRWPPVSSEHPADLNHAELNRAIMDVTVGNVRRHLDVDISTPAADVTATASAMSGGVLVANCIRLTTTWIKYTDLNT